MGITINVWDNTAQTLLNGQELMGISYEINGTTYYYIIDMIVKIVAGY